MDITEKLLLQNRAWVEEQLESDLGYFKAFSEQHPHILWIGCSDSRVPANEITNTHVGDLFVHRNIANLVVHTDFNILSVLQYAVEVLKVEHVIVCGHYGCGGVDMALSHSEMGLINKWLRNIKDVYRLHQEELNAIADANERSNRLVELNVEEQVLNLAKTSIVQYAWKNDHRPRLHGWVYDTPTGLLKEIHKVDAETSMQDIYRYDLPDK